MLLVILKTKKLLDVLWKRISKNKKFQKEFRIEKVIKKKGDKQYVEWKGCDSSFNNWMIKKK